MKTSTKTTKPRANSAAKKLTEATPSDRKPKKLTKAAGVPLLTERLPHSEVHQICFECFQPDAEEVCLAGTFNNWRTEITPMEKQPNGRWIAQLALTPGRYEYRFVIDGEWRDDPLAKRSAPNPYGGSNAVLEVGGLA